jgi:hypothetical protein
MRPIGKVRSPLTVILLTLVTLGIYGIYWQYEMYKETNEFDGEGMTGIVGLLISLFCSIVSVFLIPWQVGESRTRAGLEPRISAINGLWVILPLVGFFIWIYQVQGAANDLWEANGATAAA